MVPPSVLKNKKEQVFPKANPTSIGNVLYLGHSLFLGNTVTDSPSGLSVQ